MKLRYSYNAAPLELEATVSGNELSITLPDSGIRHLDRDGSVLTISDGNGNERRELRLPVCVTERGIEIPYRGRTYVFSEARATIAARGGRDSSGTISAPMVGIVADVMVQQGEAVAAYQPLAVVESMKVMATVEAPFEGVVSKVLIAKGDRLSHAQVMFEVEPTGAKQ